MPSALVARVIDSQANQQFDVTFERFPVRIGRNQLNDLQIDSTLQPSQFHAAIDLRDRQIFIRDLGRPTAPLSPDAEWLVISRLRLPRRPR